MCEELHVRRPNIVGPAIRQVLVKPLVRYANPWHNRGCDMLAVAPPPVPLEAVDIGFAAGIAAGAARNGRVGGQSAVASPLVR